jgi:hypothetical protein
LVADASSMQMLVLEGGERVEVFLTSSEKLMLTAIILKNICTVESKRELII